MKDFTLEIITPSKLAFSKNVKAVSLPGRMGEFQVLFNHAPLMSVLDVGKIKIKVEDNSELIFATSGGTAEVLENKVLVLVSSFEKQDEIDVERAKKSIDRAKTRLSDKSNKDVDFIRAEASLARALNRLKIANR